MPEYKEQEKEGGFSAGSAVLKATPAASTAGSAAPPQARDGGLEPSSINYQTHS